MMNYNEENRKLIDKRKRIQQELKDCCEYDDSLAESLLDKFDLSLEKSIDLSLKDIHNPDVKTLLTTIYEAWRLDDHFGNNDYPHVVEVIKYLMTVCDGEVDDIIDEEANYELC